MEKNRNIGGEKVVRRLGGQFFKRTLLVFTLLDLITGSASSNPLAQGKSKYNFLQISHKSVFMKRNFILIFIYSSHFITQSMFGSQPILPRLQIFLHKMNVNG